MNALKKLLRTGAVDDEPLSTVEILKRTPLEQLEETVRVLKQHRSAAEIRQAMIDLIATAPLAHFADPEGGLPGALRGREAVVSVTCDTRRLLETERPLAALNTDH